MKAPPAGFDVVRHGSATVWVRPEARAWTESSLTTAPTLHAAAARSGAPLTSGRGPVFTVNSPDGVWVVRHFVRGGWMAPLGDRYLSAATPRPFAETAVSEAVRARGIETPRVMAAASYSAGPFYRGDLVTELVPGSEELAEVLFGDRPAGLAATADRKEALAEAGALVGQLAAAGVHHPDLNAKNVLIQWSGRAPTAFVVDLDRCRAGTEPVSAEPMLRRLLRSLRKLERRTRLRLPPAETRLLIAAARRAT